VVAVAPGQGHGGPQRMHDGLLGGLGGGLEEQVQRAFMQQGQAGHGAIDLLRQPVGRGKGQGHVTTAMPIVRAGARQAGAMGQADIVRWTRAALARPR